MTEITFPAASVLWETGLRFERNMVRIFSHYIPRWAMVLALVEAIILTASVYVGVALRFWSVESPDLLHADFLFWRAMIFAMIFMVSMTAMGMYQRLMDDGFVGEILTLMVSFLVGAVLMSLFFYAIPNLFLGRGAFGYSLAFSFFSILTVRYIFFEFIIDWEAWKTRLLVLGTGPQAALVEEVGKKPTAHFTIVDFVARSPGEEQSIKARPIILAESLRDYAQRLKIDEILLTDLDQEGLPSEELLDCKMGGISIVDLLRFFEREFRMVRLDLLHPSWWILFSEGFEHLWTLGAAKRMLDILGSLLLLLLTWPVMLLAAAGIWLESGGRGPIFYDQVRVGLNKRNFKVRKFRSMQTDAEKDGARWAVENDTRITRIGRFIRQTRIDELPQIFNVLKGEMSLVGPRPERPEFVEMLEKKIPYFAERFRARPGITGWAQICYGYGASEEDAAEKLKFDLYYVKNQSLFLDIMVLIKTVEVVLFGKGA